MKINILVLFFLAGFALHCEDYIKILTPKNGWTTDRIITISGETNASVPFVTVYYNRIPLRLPVSEGRFAREFVAGPGLNTIYAQADLGGGREVSHAVSFYSKATAKAMKIIMMWDTDGTDVDLHVIEPTGEECYYGNPSTQIGGHLDVDIVDGYGPEIYTLAAPLKGTFTIKAHYYSDHGYPQSILKVYVVLFEGTPQEEIREFETALTKTGNEVYVDTVTLE